MSATEGVNYVRARLPARHLPGLALSMRPLDEPVHKDGEGRWRLSRQRGAAVWMTAGNATLGMLMVQQRLTGHRVLMEVDDNYLEMPPVHFGTWRRDLDVSGDDQHSLEAHARLVPHVDGVIVSTPELERVYRRVARQVFLCRNCVDPDDWDGAPPHGVEKLRSRSLFARPEGVLRVGFAGSDSHLSDFEAIRPALELAAGSDGCEVVLVGIPQAKESFPCRRFLWTDDLAEYRRWLRNIDVMLCPLVADDAWTRGKSDLKALEAAMAGAVAVVSRREPFRPWWEREMPCLVVDDPASPRGWVKAVRWLLGNRGEAAALAAAARDYAVKERSIQGNVWRWQEAVAADVAVAA